MAPSPAALATTYGVVAAVDTALATRGTPAARAVRRLTKPALMPLLSAAFLAATPQQPDAVRRATVAAHALSGVGDVALLGEGDAAFLTGVGGFLGAHVAYVGAFHAAGPAGAGRMQDHAGARAVLATYAVAGPVLAAAAGRRSPRLRLPVLAYAGVLSAMVATSTRLGPPVDDRTRRTVVAGTALFLASDATLGAREFLVRDPSPRTRAVLDAAVMATYTGAQALIATGLARVVRARHRAAQPAGTTSS